MPSVVESSLSRTAGEVLGLVGRTVVVTGASAGIGEDVALGLARYGMNVVGTGRREAELDRVSARAAAEGLNLSTFVADVTDEASTEASIDYAISTYGPLHGVVANAGIAFPTPALDITAEQFRSVIDTNLVGAFLTARCAARKLVEHGGSVVFTGSTFSKLNFPAFAAYNASKAALAKVTETLALEWASHAIRVNAVAPTATRTSMSTSMEDPDQHALIIGSIPMRRILEAEELLLPVAFFLSPRNEMLTGQTLFVDGGQTL